MSRMPDMTPTSLAVAVAPDTGKIIKNGLCVFVSKKVRVYTDEKLTLLKGAWHLKGLYKKLFC